MAGETQLVVGAGAVGRRVAERLVERGDHVRLATRSGAELPGAHPVTADAADAAELTAAVDGAQTIFICTGPRSYTTEEWERAWPPVFRAAIAAARDTRARLVVTGNLYPYGPLGGPMTEESPEHPATGKGRVRHEGWAALKAATDAGELRAAEVRASDFFGPGVAIESHLGERFFVPVLKSRTAYIVGDPAVPHSWSYVDDIAATLIAAADWQGPWGHVWHVPSGRPHSRDEIAATLNEWFGSHGRTRTMPQWALQAAGLVRPQFRGIAEESWQFRHPFIVDASETERMLGVHATDWGDALRTTAESYLR
ncbi:NAD-dependent epimerase/dehydratase family protein [Gryllotalpicola reticulitermitis]|uniref:NAD-dependent epimerase/dehydratase family protein n=1 Tax=Gryllotalpicola reticulitermitis TaxID=1184153 RepID=A0ABV8Q3V1_9MICO